MDFPVCALWASAASPPSCQNEYFDSFSSFEIKLSCPPLQVSISFVGGVGMVLLSVYIYSKPTVAGKVEVGHPIKKKPPPNTEDKVDKSGISRSMIPDLQSALDKKV